MPASGLRIGDNLELTTVDSDLDVVMPASGLRTGDVSTSTTSTPGAPVVMPASRHRIGDAQLRVDAESVWRGRNASAVDGQLELPLDEEGRQ